MTQINGNAEINAIKQILGLQHGKVAVTAPSVGRQSNQSSQADVNRCLQATSAGAACI